MQELTRLVPFTHEVPVELHRPEDADGSLVVALHGMGMSAASFAKDALPLLPERASLLLPQAPLPYEVRGMSGLRQGNAWYVYTGDTGPFLEAMARTEEWLLRQVDFAVQDGGFDAKRVALVGFSQGGYLAGWTGIRHPARFSRVVVAAARIKHEVLEADARRAGPEGQRVLQVHGEDDPSVGVAPARASCEALVAWGLPCEFRVYRGGHAVLRDPACIADVRRFLAS
jgi:phospholipase/carboxylesterase